MLLAIDVGNTNTVLGLFDGERARRARGGSRPTRGPPPTRWRSSFRGLLADEPGDRPASPLCSTVPAVLRELRDDARALLRRRAARHRRAGREDRRAGADGQPEGGRRRPHRQHPRGASPVRRPVRSSSTSAPPPTSTSSPRKGEFLGGALAPGIEISLDALAARAAQLRKVELVAPALGDREEHGRGAAVRVAVRLRRPGRRPGRAGSSPSSEAGQRGHRHRRARAVRDPGGRRPSPRTVPT